MFPSSASLMECRLPSALSFRNYPIQRPSDTIQGELDYNPFIFDVGILQHLTPVVPMLAPFLDKMTTRNLSSRFTAAEALEFFEHHVLDSQIVVLDIYIPMARPLDQPRIHYDECDRWKHLDPT
ncbi:hypothetical protein H0H93_011339, partial [Arthromyces matolae]